jgi:outer membrane protein assembly factor BamB
MAAPGLPLRGQAALSGTGEEAGTARDLTPFWRQALGGSVIGHPTAQAGSVVMVCEGGMLRAYSWQGAPLWIYYTQGRFTPFVSRSREGTSYVARTTGLLLAVNRVGRELWRIKLGAALAAPVLVGWDGRIFAFTGEQAACYTAAGHPLWRQTLESSPALPPVLDLKGGFITVLENGKLLRSSPFGSLWTRPLSAVPALILSLRLEEEGEPVIFVAYHNGSMELFGEDPGEPPRVLKTVLPGRPLSAAAREGQVALTLEDGRVVLVDGAGGEVLWTGRSHIVAGELAGAEPGEVSTLYDERGVYVLSRRGASGLTAQGGRRWFVRFSGSPALPAFSDEGVLYSGGGDWILYAYRPEEQVRVLNMSLYGPAPEGTYGLGTPPPAPGWEEGEFFFFGEEDIRLQLNRIEEDLRLGRVGGLEREYAAYLMGVAGSFMAAGPAPREAPRVPVQYRAAAAGLLAYLGSRETIPFLAELFTRDPEATVKAAAAQSIGRIGVDPEGIALKTFSNAVFPPVPLGDDQVLAAVASATGALCRFSGPPLSEAGVRLLTALGLDERPWVVKTQARRELQSLR